MSTKKTTGSNEKSANGKPSTKNTRSKIPADAPIDNKDVPAKKTMKFEQLSPEQITCILTDKYHENMSADNIRKKHAISAATYGRVIKEFGEKFQEKFGDVPDKQRNEKVLSYWDQVELK